MPSSYEERRPGGWNIAVALGLLAVAFLSDRGAPPDQDAEDASPMPSKEKRDASTDDLSLFMLGTLTLGLGLWIIYGFIRGGWMIVAANVVGATLAAIVFCCKIRDLRSRGRCRIHGPENGGRDDRDTNPPYDHLSF
ncbi:hypothetical protein CT676_41775 [Bradyrhizobium sp. MOS001]|nr:hypothetical protein CT676_41775 [Bradyrhizobium sp. MOS001]